MFQVLLLPPTATIGSSPDTRMNHPPPPRCRAPAASSKDSPNGVRRSTRSNSSQVTLSTLRTSYLGLDVGFLHPSQPRVSGKQEVGGGVCALARYLARPSYFQQTGTSAGEPKPPKKAPSPPLPFQPPRAPTAGKLKGVFGGQHGPRYGAPLAEVDLCGEEAAPFRKNTPAGRSNSVPCT